MPWWRIKMGRNERSMKIEIILEWWMMGLLYKRWSCRVGVWWEVYILPCHLADGLWGCLLQLTKCVPCSEQTIQNNVSMPIKFSWFYQGAVCIGHESFGFIVTWPSVFWGEKKRNLLIFESFDNSWSNNLIKLDSSVWAISHCSYLCSASWGYSFLVLIF